MPDITFASPAYWKDGLDPETSRLTSDLCKIEDEDFFLRCLLEIPICETSVSLGWGVWSSISRANFDLYIAEYDSDNPSGPFFGWFSNSLPGYAETLSLRCSLQPQNSGLRPILELEPADHQLAIDQRDGITVERALEFIELCGLRVLSV